MRSPDRTVHFAWHIVHLWPDPLTRHQPHPYCRDMPSTRLLATLGAAMVMLMTGCADDTDATLATSTSGRPDHAFDEVRHIVIEQHDTDAHEIVTATAHLCSVTDITCPDGTEELIVLGSHQFLPHDVHLYDPDTVLQPPEQCLDDGSYCLLSVSHCEFASAEDMADAEHCVPEGSRFVEAAANFDPVEHHECITAEAEASRHVDLDCVRDAANQINESASATEEDTES